MADQTQVIKSAVKAVLNEMGVATKKDVLESESRLDKKYRLLLKNLSAV